MYDGIKSLGLWLKAILLFLKGKNLNCNEINITQKGTNQNITSNLRLNPNKIKVIKPKRNSAEGIKNFSSKLRDILGIEESLSLEVR